MCPTVTSPALAFGHTAAHCTQLVPEYHACVVNVIRVASHQGFADGCRKLR